MAVEHPMTATCSASGCRATPPAGPLGRGLLIRPGTMTPIQLAVAE